MDGQDSETLRFSLEENCESTLFECYYTLMRYPYCNLILNMNDEA